MREHDLDRDPPSADLLAGEYVLGVLDAAQRREARLRMQRDPAFARLVDEWAQRLETMNDELAPEEPAAHVWPRLRTRLGWAPVERAREGGRLRLWQGATAAGFAAAAALAAVVLVRPQVAPPTEAPAQVAQEPARGRQGLADMPLLPVTKLVSDDGSPTFVASIDRDSGGMWLVPMLGDTKTGDRLPVLWLIPEGEAPRALGFVNERHSHWVQVPKEMREQLSGGAVLAITLEPASDAAPAAPSSAPVAAGSITL